MAAMEWVGETWRTYVGNATSVRDFRVQMRGSKTILAWSLYLVVLLFVAYSFYATVYTQQSYNMSAASLQNLLRSSFSTILNTVAGAVVVIAPGLTAASIVGERQRKSFDLVFTAPVTPKYYLVGKMLGSYRYTIMLLVLSVPVLALTAMLGGATWGDIAVCYFLLSLNGLVLTSIALLVSSIVQKVQPAVATSYVLIGLYVMATLLVSSAVMFSSYRGFGTGSGPVGEQPFIATLNPFMVYQFYGTYTVIGASKVPNWILNAAYTIAIVRLMLLGAGSALSPYGSAETKSLRIQAILYTFALTLLFVYFPMTSTRTTGNGFFITVILLLLISAVPWIASWGESERRVTTSDAAWSWKRMFVGTPSGAGPYLILLCGAVAAGSYWVGNSRGIPRETIHAHLVHGFGVLVFFAGLTRWFCSRTGYARGKLFANLVIVGTNIVMPIFLMVAISSAGGYSSGTRIEERREWLAWPMWPIAADMSYATLYVYGLMCGIAGALFWLSSEARAKALRNRDIKPPEWQFENR